jgi:hypothetical protein
LRTFFFSSTTTQLAVYTTQPSLTIETVLKWNNTRFGPFSSSIHHNRVIIIHNTIAERIFHFPLSNQVHRLFAPTQQKGTLQEPEIQSNGLSNKIKNLSVCQRILSEPLLWLAVCAPTAGREAIVERASQPQSFYHC